MKISGKNLGELALKDVCYRCFWFKQHLKREPFFLFPGIFSTFDAFTKKYIHAIIDEHREHPKWLRELGAITGYIDPPSHHKFRLLDEETQVIITGVADGIYKRDDGSYVIIDYKTAKFTAYQDELFPMYEVQLNVYAMIAESLGIDPVSGLALVYFDPSFSQNDIMRWPREYGFDMGFAAHVLPVEIDAKKVHELLRLAKEICSMSRPPQGGEGCKNCKAIDELRDFACLV